MMVPKYFSKMCAVFILKEQYSYMCHLWETITQLQRGYKTILSLYTASLKNSIIACDTTALIMDRISAGNEGLKTCMALVGKIETQFLFYLCHVSWELNCLPTDMALHHQRISPTHVCHYVKEELYQQHSCGNLRSHILKTWWPTGLLLYVYLLICHVKLVIILQNHFEVL